VACFRTRDARRKSDRGAAEPFSRYETKVEAGTGRLRVVGAAEFFETSSYRRDSAQQRLFALADLGEAVWLKVLRLERYAPRVPRRPQSLQQTLFPYHEALG
jgi:hypothetical protein